MPQQDTGAANRAKLRVSQKQEVERRAGANPPAVNAAPTAPRPPLPAGGGSVPMPAATGPPLPTDFQGATGAVLSGQFLGENPYVRAGVLDDHQRVCPTQDVWGRSHVASWLA